ncbi:MAG: hypothetical protein Q9M23_04555 [Mariprofundaceae bacterium]|nr:hypothetical protein [Mariprofundaceae bacterium]
MTLVWRNHPVDESTKTLVWRCFVITLVVLVHLFVSVKSYADETVMLKTGYMMLDVKGSFAASGAGIPGSLIDVDSALKLNRSNGMSVEGAVQLGDVRASLNYFPIDFSGDGVLASTVQYNGQAYAAGNAVHASLKADVFDASLTYYLLNMDDLPSRLQLGVEATVKIVYATSSLQDQLTGQAQSKSATLSIPTLGARGRVAVSDLVGLTGRAGYMGYAGNHFLDSEVQFEFSPLPTAGVYAGYRLIDLKLDRAGVLLNNNISGPFVGGFVRF